MNITELLSPENIRQGVSFSSKKRLFESIAHFVIEQVNDEKGEQVCLECLFEREKLTPWRIFSELNNSVIFIFIT